MPDDNDADWHNAPRADDVTLIVDEIVSTGLDRIEELTDTLLKAVRAGVPSYADGRSPLEIQDLRTAIHRAALILLGYVGRVEAPAEKDVVSLTMIGAQRAREGMPMEQALEVLRLCRKGVLAFLLGAWRDGDHVSPDTAFAAGAAIAERLDECGHSIETALRAGYAEIAAHIERGGGIPNEASFANLILDGRWNTESDVREQLARLGKPLGGAHGVVVLVPSRKTDQALFAEAARAMGTLLGGTVLIEAPAWTPVLHVPIVISMRSASEWQSQLSPVAATVLDAEATQLGVRAVVSDTVECLDDIPQLYVAIRRDLGYLRAAYSGGWTVPARRLDLFAVIAGDGRDIGRLTQLVYRVFGLLQQQPNADELMAIVDAYYRSNGKWEQVRQTLGLHRNTLTQRVEKIEELTGLSFRSVADVHELLTCFRLGVFLRGEFDALDLDPGDR